MHEDDGERAPRPRTAPTSAGSKMAGRVSRSLAPAGSGAALGVAFARAGWQVAAVASRDEGRRTRFQQLVAGARAFEQPQAVARRGGADLPRPCPTTRSPEVAGSLHLYSGQALVHTSGALPASVLEPAVAAGTNIGGLPPARRVRRPRAGSGGSAGRDRRARGRRVAAGAAGGAGRGHRCPAGDSARRAARPPITRQR